MLKEKEEENEEKLECIQEEEHVLSIYLLSVHSKDSITMTVLHVHGEASTSLQTGMLQHRPVFS